MKFLQTIIASICSVATHAIVSVLAQKKQALHAGKGELERQLEAELAEAIGIPKSKVHVEYFICGDGEVVPSIAFECALSKAQQMWATAILDSYSTPKQNMRSDSSVN